MKISKCDQTTYIRLSPSMTREAVYIRIHSAAAIHDHHFHFFFFPFPFMYKFLLCLLIIIIINWFGFFD